MKVLSAVIVVGAAASVGALSPSKGSCITREVGIIKAGTYIPNNHVLTAWGMVGVHGHIYVRCDNGVLTCRQDNGIADAMEMPKVNCEKANANRKLGVMIDPEKILLWPNQTMCYSYDSKFSKDKMKLMKEGWEHLKLTGLTFMTVKACKKHPNKKALCGGCKNFVSIRNDKPGCFAAVGYQAKGGQNFNIHDDCFAPGYGRFVHEVFHSLGIYHEHVHAKRNIIIIPSELKVARNNYMMKIDSVHTKYDEKSIMHYSQAAGVCIPQQKYKDVKFCDIVESEAQGCVEPLPKHCDKDASSVLGQRKGMSDEDIATVKAMYGCTQTGKEATIWELQNEQKAAAKKGKKGDDDDDDDDEI
ncbi:hypothetical protein DYB28_014838 [Aphanomyces astaci]|uniref:Metalloendopeptidase n=1 Tax=Aphanomyces astaci TaxID=112090 RepID=A0A397BWI2_APHAT|nr:hypothetical protein DYB25_009413 [Aphanomyces astaci]RHY24324.1 hypothetical protein DYB36_012587 [Aphanomyces astaci]RHY39722.1 hypothetical protein DYB30_010855 [Aphanomyces astaci]RHY42780.1 hypothetical protein DYB34_012484 [Aphanomyces astaci]RHY51925.1 hypothetical protein DYB38_005572 [Aphanomyces astaci]